MSGELDLAPDLASQQWWDDNWVDVVAGGSICNPTLAWRYFATSIFIDHETDNWNLHVQFSEDPSFDWTRMEEYALPSFLVPMLIQRGRTLRTMYGKQYRFNVPRCQPPGFWLIEKIHKYQQNVRNDLGRMEAVTKERLLEVFVITDRKVMKCSTLYDLANIRMLGAMHSLETTLSRLRSKIPPPNVRETTFWQSATLKVPEDTVGAEPHAAGVPETALDQSAAKDKAKRKRPDPYQLSILHAMQTTQNAIPGLISITPEGAKAEIKTTEEERAERLMRSITGSGAGEALTGTGGGVKRATDEALRSVAKQARFQV